MALMQHKQDLVTAIKAQQFTAAAAVLEKALAMAPDDPLLLEFQTAVQAKLDHNMSSSDGESECSQNSACEATDDERSTDERSSSSTSGSDSDADATSGQAAAAVGAALDDKHGRASAVAQLQHALHGLSQQESSDGSHVSSISLAASSCALTPQRRHELKQQLAASISQQKDALAHQQLMKSDPLLSAVLQQEQ